MPFALTLRLDPAAASQVATLWQALAAAGIDSDRDELGYPAHVTLGVFADDAPIDALQAAHSMAAARWRALPITLAGIGMFPGAAAIVWAVPVPSEALLARHAALLAALPQVAPHSHYCAGAWVPHITLSGALPDPTAALRTLLPLWRPLRGTLDRLELVRFRPVEILHSAALPA